ncbi:outer membrane receptor protein [Caulobacter sp. AP07]|uniref:TonB-dependent receptor n=1 Tax=Caulobacter sp. AP07 TaxID=1144304 RepID=UPI0002720C68|nr:TonB-dependent receptor [Caulobacter sp. AP07]EJL27349.1 outer membrane receptor protein [Caulobacter sp. AP07]
MTDIKSCKPSVRLIALRYSGLVSMIAAMGAVASAAHAQVATPVPPAAQAPSDAGSVQIEEVIVTATRQSASAQSVPIALTAVGADTLRKEGVTSAAQLSTLSPSLYVLNTVSAGSPRFTLRGLTTTDTLPTGSAAVATYIDDVYQASQFGITAGLFDIQRVEILRGPQGTTFGKNTTGGAVAYFSQTPTNELGGYVNGRVGAGARPERYLEAAVNVPVIDDILAMRFSLKLDSQSGYLYDQANRFKRGEAETQSGRFQLRWTPRDGTVANLTVFSTRERGDTPLGRAQVLPAAQDGKYISLSDYRFYDNFDNNGATLRLEQALGAFNLTSITHYRKTDTDNDQDLDGSANDIFFYTSKASTEQYGQEVRVASDAGRRLSGLVGLYFQKDETKEVGTESSTLFGLGADFNNLSRYDTRTTTYAVFANLTYKFTDQISATGGLRKSSESKKQAGSKLYFQDGNYDWDQTNIVFDGPPPVAPSQALIYNLRQKSTPWTWDATINYKPAERVMLFARISKGFRSGGFNPGATVFAAASLPAPVPDPYEGETVKAYELGLKSSLFDNRVRFNAGVYHYDYSNQQVTVYNNGLVTTANASAAKVDGAEAELTALVSDRLELRGTLSYTDGRYDQYSDPFIGADYSGNRLIQAAKWGSNLSATYTLPVTGDYDLRANTTWSYRSRVYFDSANDPVLSGAPLTTGNLRVGFDPHSGSGFALAFYANNITDKRALASGFGLAPGYFLKYFDIGRTYGLDLSYRW